MQGARRNRCGAIVDDEQRRRRAETPCRPSGCGRHGAICGVATPRRWTRIACGVAPCIWPHGARNATVQTSTTGCWQPAGARYSEGGFEPDSGAIWRSFGPGRDDDEDRTAQVVRRAWLVAGGAGAQRAGLTGPGLRRPADPGRSPAAGRAARGLPASRVGRLLDGRRDRRHQRLGRLPGGHGGHVRAAAASRPCSWPWSEVADSYEAGRRLALDLPDEGLVHVLVIADGTLVNGSALVRGLNDHLPGHHPGDRRAGRRRRALRGDGGVRGQRAAGRADRGDRPVRRAAAGRLRLARRLGSVRPGSPDHPLRGQRAVRARRQARRWACTRPTWATTPASCRPAPCSSRSPCAARASATARWCARSCRSTRTPRA